MNYAVVRRADTNWGSAFAFELASQKRHLILLGSGKDDLRDMAVRIRLKYQVYIHYFEVDESDMADIISICDQINAHFEVDILINYAEKRSDSNFADLDIYNLGKELRASLIASPVFTHQLLPNLMLHADAGILELRHTSFEGHFSVNDEISCHAGVGNQAVSASCKELPWTNTCGAPAADFAGIAKEILVSLIGCEDEATVG